MVLLSGDSVGLEQQLREALRAPFGDDTLTVHALQRLSGGSSRESWAFEVHANGSTQKLALRRDPPDRLGDSTVWREVAAIRAATAAGVPAPDVLFQDEGAALGSPSMVMSFVHGEAIPRRILREPDLCEARRNLAFECGEILARMLDVSRAEVPSLPESDRLDDVVTFYDELAEPHPAVELGFQWLRANRPAPGRQGLVHGDFRLGNILVTPGGVSAVLDWELARWGDPLEDLGWLCVKSWRFRSPKPVGGFGDYDELLAGYEHGRPGQVVDREALLWWEVFGTLRWAVECIGQVHRHLTGQIRTVDLAALGRRTCEPELDLLRLIAPGRSGHRDSA